MQTKLLTTILLAMTMCSSVAFAGQGRARVDLSVKKGELTFYQKESGKFQMFPASWIKDEEAKKRYLTSNLVVSDEKWTQVKLVVSSSQDTTIKVSLRGQWHKTMKNWAYFDDVEAQGATFKNSGFEEEGGWHFDKSQQVLDESLAHTGKGAVLVWHDKAASQYLEVKAGEKVTITAWVKFCKQEPKNPK